MTPAKNDQKDVERIVSEANESRLGPIVQKFKDSLPADATVTGRTVSTSIHLTVCVDEASMAVAKAVCESMIEPLSYPEITVSFKASPKTES